MNNINVNAKSGLVMLEDTRNKKGKPVRASFEKGATEAGTTVRLQALPYGDYALVTPAINEETKKAYLHRMRDLRGDCEYEDLVNHFVLMGDSEADAKKHAFVALQWQSNHTTLIKRLNSLTKLDLAGLYTAAVETKWRMDELIGCIDSYDFCHELELAARFRCAMLVLVVTDRQESLMQVQECERKVNSLGAYFAICTPDDEYGVIENFLTRYERMK